MIRMYCLKTSVAVLLAALVSIDCNAQGRCIPGQSRCLIIEAEDLGMAASIDGASFKALDSGWLTATEVLVPAPWFPEVVRWERTHPRADVGLQFDLNSEWAKYRWRPISARTVSAGLIDPAGYLPNDAKYIADHAKPDEVAAEFSAQIDAANRAGLKVSHFDSHGGIVLYRPWLFNEYWKTARAACKPAVLSKEWVRERGKPSDNPSVYDIAGMQVDMADVPFDRILQLQPGVSKENWLKAYENMLTGLPSGVYLLQVHLGFDDEELQAITADHPNWGAEWRQNDYDVISSPEFQKFLKDQGFILIDWKDIMKIVTDRKAAEAAQKPQ